MAEILEYAFHQYGQEMFGLAVFLSIWYVVVKPELRLNQQRDRVLAKAIESLESITGRLERMHTKNEGDNACGNGLRMTN